MRKAGILLFTAVLTGTLLAGCAGKTGSRFSTAESCIYISQDGSLSSALVKAYEGVAVDEKDLNQYLEAAVIRYNKENGGAESAVNSGGPDKLPAALQSVTVADGTMTAVFDYATVEDLMKFRHTADNEDTSNTLTSLRVEKLTAASGNDSVQRYKLLKPDQSKLTSEDFKLMEGATAVTAEGSGRIMFAGKVLFMTEGAEKIDDYTVQIPEGKKVSIVFK